MYRSAREVDSWLRFGALWHLEPTAVVRYMGDDIDSWQRMLTEVPADKKIAVLKIARLRS